MINSTPRFCADFLAAVTLLGVLSGCDNSKAKRIDSDIESATLGIESSSELLGHIKDGALRGTVSVEFALKKRGDFYLVRGESYRKKGREQQALADFENAIRDFTSAIAEAPDYTPAYEGRGAAYTAKGDADKAEKDMHKLKELLSSELLLGIDDDLQNATERVQTEGSAEAYSIMQHLFCKFGMAATWFRVRGRFFRFPILRWFRPGRRWPASVVMPRWGTTWRLEFCV
jgi:tetratricopeptide (TPR) repeat protein